MDVGSAASLQASLAALRDHPDPRMLDIVQLIATKPMQVRHSYLQLTPLSCASTCTVHKATALLRRTCWTPS